MRQLKWTQIFISLLLGLILGAAICALGNHGRYSKNRDSEKRKQEMLHKFSTKLKLTAAQENQVSVILENKRQKIDALRSQVHPQFEEIRNTTRLEIKKILNEDQQAKFDKLDAELRDRWKKH